MNHTEQLRKHRTRLMEEVDLRNTTIVDRLYQEEVISVDLKERLQNSNQPNGGRVGVLLDHLERRSLQDYDLFRAALQENGQQHVVKGYLPQIASETPIQRVAWAGTESPVGSTAECLVKEEGHKGSSADLEDSGVEMADRLASPMRGLALKDEIKCVAVGDSNIGKERMLDVYATERGIQNAGQIEYTAPPCRGMREKFWVISVSGQEEDFDQRSLCYYETDVFLMCFSVVNQDSYRNIMDKWKKELETPGKKWLQRASIILVGTQSDLRDDSRSCVSKSKGEDLAKKMGAYAYVECNDKDKKTIEKVFLKAMHAYLENRRR